MKKYEGALKKYESMKFLYDGFVSGKDEFPVEECRNQRDGEKDIFDGENYYYVVVCNDLSTALSYAYIEKAKPYIHINGNSEKSYGWIDCDGYVISCAFNPIVEMGIEYVCAWRIAE